MIAPGTRLLPTVGQVWKSSDHRNRYCPWLHVVEVTEDWVIVQRYKDQGLREPRGEHVPIRLRAWRSPAVSRVI